MTALFSLLQQLVALMMAIINLLGLNNKNIVTVELYTNPSSGYSWEYSYDRIDVLVLSDNNFIPDSSAILSGGGGTQVFEFRALSSGTVNITFSYVNKNDKSVASEYIYTYTVDDTGKITLQSIQ
ncbi:MAG: protease inhibitor I42 family protein [Clostridia bacterium]|nr:protease inhibitor I42 family protein [Clostridia bacterium]